MIRPRRLHHLLLIIAMLAPSTAVGHAWAEVERRAEISAVDGAPAGELLLPRPTKEPVASGTERHAGRELGKGPAGGAFCALDILRTSVGAGILPAPTTHTSCRPFAERLPYDATAPPDR